MKRLTLVLLIVAFSWNCVAQAVAADAPASKEDVQRYLQIVQSHDMLKKTIAAMSQGMHSMLHEQYLKHQDELPADYESKMAVRMDEMFQNMPWDEMLQAMAPVYQKHFTKGDIDNLVAFYSSPTGEKLLRDMPSIMAESMQTMAPIMTKYMETVQEKLQKETDDMIAQSKKPAQKTPVTHN